MSREPETDVDGRIALDNAHARAPETMAPQYLFDGDGRKAEIRPVPGYPGYLVTEDGEVYSRMRYPDGFGKILNVFVDRDGYARVHVSLDGKKCVRDVHRFVALAFLGPPPDGKPEIRHKDGNPSNSHYTNLVYGSHKDNMEDRAAHGRNPRGSRNGRAILNEDQVRDIKARLAAGHSRRQIARDLKIPQHFVNSIANGSNWSHVA